LSIHFSFTENFKYYHFKPQLKDCIHSILKEEKKKLGEIYFIFTGNPEILEINKTYLKHDYFTDVITFSESKRDNLSGDIYISLDQVKINAERFNTSVIIELARVIIHGILHLIGYNDKTENEQKLMREKEDTYLCRFNWNDIITESEANL
jgi:rRNA maturation RNase YbeY